MAETIGWEGRVLAQSPIGTEKPMRRCGWMKAIVTDTADVLWDACCGGAEGSALAFGPTKAAIRQRYNNSREPTLWTVGGLEQKWGADIKLGPQQQMKTWLARQPELIAGCLYK